MAGYIVPNYTITIIVVQNSQTGLVVVFLQSLNGNSDVEFGFDGSFFDTFIVIGLGNSIPGK